MAKRVNCSVIIGKLFITKYRRFSQMGKIFRAQLVIITWCKSYNKMVKAFYYKFAQGLLQKGTGNRNRVIYYRVAN